ncbi:unnamed protein product [Ectocarpus sp. CCAP 1310/34]|nr:unnamed protein product [Ectocarpus sp. CCAP 1310/34]
MQVTQMTISGCPRQANSNGEKTVC